jgi:hypothetical protein
MSNPIFIGQDLDLYTVTATSEQTAYPANNIKTGFAADVWKSDSLSQTQSYIVDLGSAKTIDSAVFENHNLDELGIGASDEIYISLSLNGTDYTVNYTWSNAGPSADPVCVSWAPTSCRYIKLHFLNSGALSAKPQIGNLVYGLKLDFGKAADFNYPVSPRSFETALSKSLSGVVRTSQAYKDRFLPKLSFRGEKGGLTDTVAASWNTFFALMRGRMKPFYFIDEDAVIWYVHMDLDINPITKYRVNMNGLEIPLMTQLVTS